MLVPQFFDYWSHKPGTCFLDPDFNVDMPTACVLQDAVTKPRIESGKRAIGYKVGCTGPLTAAQFRIDWPIRGALFEDEAFKHDTIINPDKFYQLAIEGEMAVRIG